MSNDTRSDNVGRHSQARSPRRSAHCSSRVVSVMRRFARAGRLRVAALLVPLIVLAVVAGLAAPAAQAAGTAQLQVTVVPVNPATGDPITTFAYGQAIGFKVDWVCCTDR